MVVDFYAPTMNLLSKPCSLVGGMEDGRVKQPRQICLALCAVCLHLQIQQKASLHANRNRSKEPIARSLDADHDIASRKDSLHAPPPYIVIVIMAEAIHPSPRGITDRCALLL
jgi:hypothetical protein